MRTRAHTLVLAILLLWPAAGCGSLPGRAGPAGGVVGGGGGQKGYLAVDSRNIVFVRLLFDQLLIRRPSLPMGAAFSLQVCRL